MLEKLKNLADSAKGVLLYIIAPLVFVAGYIWYLFSQNEALKDRIARDEGDKALNESFDRAKKAQEEANASESDYATTRDKYLAQHPSGREEG